MQDYPHNIQRGDLRIIDAAPGSSADRRIGLVSRIRSADFVEVLLVHTAPELSTDHDVILPSELTSAPYTVVAQTDLRSVVWISQLGKRVGCLSESVLAATAMVGSGSEPSELATGTPLAGVSDRRWSFKESEGAALRALAADCTETLLD